MTTMANITVKAADGTTDVVFNAMAPSSGDTTAAVWRAEALGDGISANRPRFELRTRFNGQRTARRVDIYFTAPYYVTQSADSTTKVVANIPVNATFTVPANIPEDSIADFVSYAVNLMASTLVKAAISSGYAPS
jgi:hypothetical protein